LTSISSAEREKTEEPQRGQKWRHDVVLPFGAQEVSHLLEQILRHLSCQLWKGISNAVAVHAMTGRTYGIGQRFGICCRVNRPLAKQQATSEQ